MKSRNGFVSNSSSSSFVISTTPTDKGKVLVSIDLTQLGGKICKTETQLKSAFEYHNGFDANDPKCYNEPDYAETRKLYDRCLADIRSDKAIVMGRIDNDMIGILEYVQGNSEVLERDGYIEI